VGECGQYLPGLAPSFWQVQWEEGARRRRSKRYIYARAHRSNRDRRHVAAQNIVVPTTDRAGQKLTCMQQAPPLSLVTMQQRNDVDVIIYRSVLTSSS
jgi:hypothetical protein